MPANEGPKYLTLLSAQILCSAPSQESQQLLARIWQEAAESLSHSIHRDFVLRPFLETESLTCKHGREKSPLPENCPSLPLPDSLPSGTKAICYLCIKCLYSHRGYQVGFGKPQPPTDLMVFSSRACKSAALLLCYEPSAPVVYLWALRKPLSAPAGCLLSLTLPGFHSARAITTVLAFTASFGVELAESAGADLFPLGQAASQPCSLRRQGSACRGRAMGQGSIHQQRRNRKISSFPTGRETGVSTSTGTCFLLPTPRQQISLQPVSSQHLSQLAPEPAKRQPKTGVAAMASGRPGAAEG